QERLSLPCLGLTFAEAQTVTQPEDQVFASEGSSVELKCTYSYSGNPFLQWYVWYPNQGPQFLLRHTSKESNKGFWATLNKTESSYHLRKLQVQEEDSATYFCAISGFKYIYIYVIVIFSID
uniref:Ig-like domain-containing protein n=1 Tax=Sarcophilus harrisii TaxID=9305 RepID=G3VNY3_SARHA